MNSLCKELEFNKNERKEKSKTEKKEEEKGEKIITKGKMLPRAAIE